MLSALASRVVHLHEDRHKAPAAPPARSLSYKRDTVDFDFGLWGSYNRIYQGGIEPWI